MVKGRTTRQQICVDLNDIGNHNSTNIYMDMRDDAGLMQCTFEETFNYDRTMIVYREILTTAATTQILTILLNYLSAADDTTSFANWGQFGLGFVTD